MGQDISGPFALYSGSEINYDGLLINQSLPGLVLYLCGTNFFCPGWYFFHQQNDDKNI